jgi:hypothetical protein
VVHRDADGLAFSRLGPHPPGQLIGARQPRALPQRSMASRIPASVARPPASVPEIWRFVDEVSDFYAQHPALVKALGAAALAIAISKIRALLE